MKKWKLISTSFFYPNAETTNGNTYLIACDDSTARNRIKVAGSGGTTVTSDANGNITINSTTTSATTIRDDLTGNGVANAALSANQGYVLANGSARDNTKLPTAGGTLSGALNFANGTWNLVGDDAYMGDCNVAGCIGIKGKNGNTGISFQPYSGSTAQTITTNGSGTMTISGSVTIATSLVVNGPITGVKVYNAVWNADYAEAFNYEGDKPTIGTIVELTSNEKVKVSTKDSEMSIGVISDTYCILAGAEEKEVIEGRMVAVGLIGQLMVRVTGSVKTGDRIYIGENGVGYTSKEKLNKPYIGLAMTNNENEDEKLVNCIIK